MSTHVSSIAGLIREAAIVSMVMERLGYVEDPEIKELLGDIKKLVQENKVLIEKNIGPIETYVERIIDDIRKRKPVSPVPAMIPEPVHATEDIKFKFKPGSKERKIFVPKLRGGRPEKVIDDKTRYRREREKEKVREMMPVARTLHDMHFLVTKIEEGISC